MIDVLFATMTFLVWVMHRSVRSVDMSVKMLQTSPISGDLLAAQAAYI